MEILKLIMASQKIWVLKYVVGNPMIFSKVTTAAGSPMKRSEAIEGAQTISTNGGNWRVWVENAESGKRIFESEVEKQHTAAPIH